MLCHGIISEVFSFQPSLMLCITRKENWVYMEWFILGNCDAVLVELQTVREYQVESGSLYYPMF